MKWRDFFDQFESITEAPEGVDRLRELVLELAVRGKLVPQDPEDEPASVLLERIKAERKRLEEAGETRKQKRLPPVGEDEMLFDLPPTWAWARLDHVTSYIQRGKSPKYSDTEQVPVVSQKCIQWDGFDLSAARFIDPNTLAKYQPERYLQPGDLLWNSTGLGTVGRVNLFPDIRFDYDQIVADSHVTVVRPLLITGRFVWLWLASPLTQDKVEELASGTTKQVELNKSTVRKHILPLAPLPEQHRIVARVDELMELCDELEEKQTHRFAIRRNLRDASLEALAKAETAEDLAAAWKRVREHFAELAHGPDDVDGLRQAILQLGVRGRLVPQDPGDEPAESLLARIQKDRQQLLQEGEIRTRKELPEVQPEQVGDNIPTGWAVTRFGKLLVYGPRNGYSPRAVEQPTKVKTLALSATTSGEFDPSQSKYLDEDIAPDSPLWLEPGDILIQRANTLDYVGVAAIYEGKEHEFIYPDLMMKVRVHEELDARFLHRALNSPESRAYFQSQAAGTSSSMPKINQTTLRMLPLRLPPRCEQGRIVEKIEQLLELCDELEARLSKQQATATILGTAAVKTLAG